MYKKMILAFIISPFIMAVSAVAFFMSFLGLIFYPIYCAFKRPVKKEVVIDQPMERNKLFTDNLKTDA